MPWNNQGGGGGRKGGPWGQVPPGGGGGPSQQPDLEELLKRSQDRLKQVIPGGTGVPGPLMLLIAAVMVAVVAFFAFTFRVNPDELGVVMRFGKIDRQEGPGLHFRLPYPIEEVRLPKVTRQNIIEVGMRTAAGARGGIRDVPEESLMLTGDENIVDVDFVVFWRIKDAKQYLFNIQNPDATVKEVAESAMREIVGQNNIAPILTEARQKTEAEVQKLIALRAMDKLDRLGMDGVKELLGPGRLDAKVGMDTPAPRVDRRKLLLKFFPEVVRECGVLSLAGHRPGGEIGVDESGPHLVAEIRARLAGLRNPVDGVRKTPLADKDPHLLGQHPVPVDA